MATQVTGITIDTKKLDEISSELQTRAVKILKSTAAVVSVRAKIHAPVDTGALRSSIDFEQTGKYTFQVHDGVEYGVYQEFGTYKMAAHPFMSPAIEDVRSSFENYWKELFR